jgi:hypothetical protein
LGPRGAGGSPGCGARPGPRSPCVGGPPPRGLVQSCEWSWKPMPASSGWGQSRSTGGRPVLTICATSTSLDCGILQASPSPLRLALNSAWDQASLRLYSSSLAASIRLVTSRNRANEFQGASGATLASHFSKKGHLDANGLLWCGSCFVAPPGRRQALLDSDHLRFAAAPR